jgi:hypothetical protein
MPRSTKIGSLSKTRTHQSLRRLRPLRSIGLDTIAFLNQQMAVPAMQHGYGMAAMDNDTLLALYSESLANFGATYVATHELIKSLATSLAPMQGQLANIQQFCIAVGQQPPSSIYAPAQQQQRSNSRHSSRSGGGHNHGSGFDGGKGQDNDTSLALYSESPANFGATHADTHELIKSQATSLAPMQGQLENIQQFCIAVGQQSSSSIYAPAQQQHRSNSRHSSRSGGGHNGSGFDGGKDSGGFPQQPTIICGSGDAGAQQSTCLPTPAYKRWENWNSRHSHGSDIDNKHTSTTCGKPGPRHNPNASRAIIMGRSITRMQKTILPLAAGCVPPTMRPQQQQMP